MFGYILLFLMGYYIGYFVGVYRVRSYWEDNYLRLYNKFYHKLSRLELTEFDPDHQ